MNAQPNDTPTPAPTAVADGPPSFVSMVCCTDEELEHEELEDEGLEDEELEDEELEEEELAASVTPRADF